MVTTKPIFTPNELYKQIMSCIKYIIIIAASTKYCIKEDGNRANIQCIEGLYIKEREVKARVNLNGKLR